MAGRAGPEGEGWGQAAPRLGLGGRRGRLLWSEEASGAPAIASPELPVLERATLPSAWLLHLAAPSPSLGSNGGA